MSSPVLSDGRVRIRPIKLRDSRLIEHALLSNRRWLQQWESSHPDGGRLIDVRGSIRGLLQAERAGTGLAFVMELDGGFAGQLNVWGVSSGSLRSASIGYWVTADTAGNGVTPTSVALASDLCFDRGIHRVEICIRPENGPSLRVVQKLGFRYEGLRRRYIHVDGEWRDHYAFALVAEEVRGGVLRRWRSGAAPEAAAAVPDADRVAANTPML